MSDAATASDAPAATSAPAVDASAAPAPATPPAAAPAPAAPAAAPAAPATQDKATPPNLLGDDEPKDKPTDTDDKSGDGEDDTQKTGAPEEYSEFVTEDGVKALDSDTLSSFKSLAKEANMTQETAQKFVSLAAKMQAGNVAQLQSHVDTLATEWAGQAQADAEIGGAKFKENLGIAKQALDTFGTPELKALFNESRLGNHPEVVRMLVRAGKAISQDGFVAGRHGAAPKATADVLYGSTK